MDFMALHSPARREQPGIGQQDPPQTRMELCSFRRFMRQCG
ncbi:hypothetical protein ACP26L_09255 [Paenibacillus sp. S-38]